MKERLRRFIPIKLFHQLQPWYHYGLTFLAAIFNGFPARKIKIIGITGTKGKTTSTEIVSAILEQAGYKTAIASTWRFKVADKSQRNLLKMSMPGGPYLQRFIKQAVSAGCQYLILEMTSEGTKLFRHKFVDLDALLFTNISPEHIESHGSFENYLQAKLKLADALADSTKPNRMIVANADDREACKFLAKKIGHKVPFQLKDAEPYELKATGLSFTFGGQTINAKLLGLFNLYNLLGAATLTKNLGVSTADIKKAIENFAGVRGRLEKISSGNKKQNFEVIVDYAHTADSLAKVYQIFAAKPKICVLGNTGGGRDKWKRPEMGRIAGENCQQVIITNEDPYDEDPLKIMKEVATGVKKDYRLIPDRRQAIRAGLEVATKGSVVIISGKGTDPWLMGPHGSKIAWDDAEVTREELVKVLNNK
ncbi:MAG: UDP-N-acetylmuramyl-tripeptide synthetase [Patescibacteria group bacterium]